MKSISITICLLVLAVVFFSSGNAGKKEEGKKEEGNTKVAADNPSTDNKDLGDVAKTAVKFYLLYKILGFVWFILKWTIFLPITLLYYIYQYFTAAVPQPH